jgi:hypothetical protein
MATKKAVAMATRVAGEDEGMERVARAMATAMKKAIARERAMVLMQHVLPSLVHQGWHKCAHVQLSK